MKKIKPNEIQGILLNILIAFKKFAVENDIDFLLCGGTTLGAVRHGGFIPWDDDIDIYISREARCKLIKIALLTPYIDDSHRYKILIPGEYPNVYPFIKIIDTKTVVYEKNINKKYATGIFIDLFCLSYWPDSFERTQKTFRKITFYRKMNQIVIDGNHDLFYRKLLWFILTPLRLFFILCNMNSHYWCNKILQIDNFPESNYVGDVAWPNSLKDRYKVDWFKEKSEIIFENETFFIPKDYDKILTTFYGDYMQIPPENKRVRHNFEAYFID